MANLRLTKRGSKWQYSFEIPSQNGKRKRISKSGFDTKAEANKAGTQAKALYDNGGIAGKTKKISMSDMFDLFLEEVQRTLKPTTYDTYSVRIRVHLKPMFGDYDFSKMTRPIIQNTLDDYETGKYTMNSLVTIMKSFYKWCVRRGHCEHNLMRDVIKPVIATPDAKRYLISKETFDEIVTTYPEFKVPLYLMYYTGMRKGEVIGLQWEDVDLKKGVIHLVHNMVYAGGKNVLSTPKSKSGKRDIFIGETLKRVLNEAKIAKTGIYVCTLPDGQLIDKNKLANLSINIANHITTEFNYHSLRHTHVSNLLMNGADLKAVQQRVGHSDIATTLNIYAKINESKMKETAMLSEL